MSQPRPGVVSRKQAVDSLREILNKDPSYDDPKWKWELSNALEAFAAKYFELSLKTFDGYLDTDMHKDEPSQLWHEYFVLSLENSLEDLPASTADLRKAVHELVYGDDNAAKGNPASPAASSASPATLSATPRIDVNSNMKIDVNNNKKTDANNNKKADVNTNKKRAATDHDVTQATKETKRVKTEADATNFTVHAKGPYTVRVFEGGILSAEFSSSTPATVRVKMVPGSATSAAAVVNCDESDN